jgi:hypothetical protein
VPEITPSTILRYLETHCLGRSAAQTEPVLSSALGVPGPTIRQLVHELRDAGELVGSGPTGFYIPVTYDEARAGVEHLHSRLRSLAHTYAAQKSAIRRRWPHTPVHPLPPSEPPTQAELPFPPLPPRYRMTA